MSMALISGRERKNRWVWEREREHTFFHTSRGCYTRCHRKAKKIIKDNNHVSHCLFSRYQPEGEVSTSASKLGPRDWKTASILKPSDCYIAITSTLDAAAYIHRLEITAHFNKWNTSHFNNVYISCITHMYTLYSILLYLSLCCSDISSPNIYRFLIPFL